MEASTSRREHPDDDVARDRVAKRASSMTLQEMVDLVEIMERDDYDCASKRYEGKNVHKNEVLDRVIICMQEKHKVTRSKEQLRKRWCDLKKRERTQLHRIHRIIQRRKHAADEEPKCATPAILVTQHYSGSRKSSVEDSGESLKVATTTTSSCGSDLEMIEDPGPTRKVANVHNLTRPAVFGTEHDAKGASFDTASNDSNVDVCCVDLEDSEVLDNPTSGSHSVSSVDDQEELIVDDNSMEASLVHRSNASPETHVDVCSIEDEPQEIFDSTTCHADYAQEVLVSSGEDVEIAGSSGSAHSFNHHHTDQIPRGRLCAVVMRCCGIIDEIVEHLLELRRSLGNVMEEIHKL